MTKTICKAATMTKCYPLSGGWVSSKNYWNNRAAVIEDDEKEVDSSNVDYWDYIGFLNDDKESICKKLGFDPDTVTLYQEEEVKTTSYTYSEV